MTQDTSPEAVEPAVEPSDTERASLPSTTLQYLEYLEGSHDAISARLAEVEAERDEWMVMVGRISATVPVGAALSATATIGDLIDYLKNLHTRAEAAEAKLAKAREALRKLNRRNDSLETFSAVVDEIVTEALAIIDADTPAQEGDE